MICQVEVGMSINVEVETMKISSISINKHFMINKAKEVCKEDILQKVNEEDFTNMKKKYKFIKKPY